MHSARSFLIQFNFSVGLYFLTSKKCVEDCAVLASMVQYGFWFGTVWPGRVWYGLVWCGLVRFGMVGKCFTG